MHVITIYIYILDVVFMHDIIFLVHQIGVFHK